EQLGPDRAAPRVVVARLAPRLEEHVVHHVLRLAPRAEHLHAHRQQQRRVPIIEAGEPLAISPRNRRDEDYVFVLWRALLTIRRPRSLHGGKPYQHDRRGVKHSPWIRAGGGYGSDF